MIDKFLKKFNRAGLWHATLFWRNTIFTLCIRYKTVYHNPEPMANRVQVQINIVASIVFSFNMVQTSSPLLVLQALTANFGKFKLHYS